MQIRNVVSKRLDSYQTKIKSLQGVIGNLGTGEISVPNQTGMIYVTLKTGILVVALNTRVPNIFGREVAVGFDPNDLPKILRVLWAREINNLGFDDVSRGVAYHHKQHEWPYPDTVYVWGEQFLDRLFVPVAGTLTVAIYPGTYPVTAGYKQFTVATVVDLTTSVGALTTDQAAYSVIVVDASGSFQVRDGTPIGPQVSPPLSAYMMLADSDLPALTAGDTAICAVKIYYGQLEFYCNGQRNDFVDMRFAVAAGSGGSGGVEEAPNDGNIYGRQSLAWTDLSDLFDGTNHLFIDQAGGTGSTYGALGGARNGVNTDFTVSEVAYTSGLLTVSLNGQVLPMGTENWVELSPAAGTIRFTVAPEATDIIMVVYGYTDTHVGPVGPQGIQGASYSATSTSSLSIAIASRTFVTQAGLAYNTASRVRAVSAADNANWMEGNVTSYSGTSLVVDVDIIGGSGTHADWVISLIGNIKAAVHHQQLIWEIDGAYISSLEVGVDPKALFMAYVGAGAVIEEIKAHLGTAPSTTPVRLRIKKNGSTIFTGTDYIEFGTGVQDLSRTTDFAGGGACAKDDYFQRELVQGDAVAADLTLQMRYKWTLTGL